MDKVIIDGVDVSECTYSKIGIDEKCYCEEDLYDDDAPVFTCDECTDCYYKQLQRLKEENEKLLSKCIDKQCRINELQQICAIKEFSLKVNGKEYKNLSGIDKAKLFINNENAIRDRYIQKLENKMTDLQCKFYENCKKVVDTQKQIDKYRQALQEIRDIVSEPCIVDENCQTCNSGCMQKDILTKINEVIGVEE